MMFQRSKSKRATLALTLLAAAVLSACGGGEGADESTAMQATADAAHTSAVTAEASAEVAAAPLLAAADTVGAAESAVAEPAGMAKAMALKVTNVSSTVSKTLTVRAKGVSAAGIGAMMELRYEGTTIGTAEVRATELTDYTFTLPVTPAAGARIDIVFTNDATIGKEDRALFVGYVTNGTTSLVPSAQGVTYDKGVRAAAFDGLNVIPGQELMHWGGALRFSWPAAADAASVARGYESSRFLQQATFGPTKVELDRLKTMSFSAWIDRQVAMPYVAEHVPYFQSKLDLGPSYKPGGSNYSQLWASQSFWRSAATDEDQLRKRVGYALQQIFVASLSDVNVWQHGRAYANYLDMLNKDAFGNFRTLLEDMSLSPAMAVYLSSLRNQKANGNSTRVPDENYAREVMQLFTIGLYELNIDGTPKLGAGGVPLETYNNDDVMAMAHVFTGWSWAFDDAQMTDLNFLWAQPNYNTTGDARIDLKPMKNYPTYHSGQEKRLFAGKSYGVTIPAGTAGPASLKMALDTLFNHPNVGPFIGRQLIQRLVTSNPSKAYVTRVAQTFNNNGKGVRGDMAAVVRAVLLDAEARSAPTTNAGKLREPFLRMTHWIRAFNAVSRTGEYPLANELQALSQRALHSPTVFNFYRPGYVAPNTVLATNGLVAPEFQIANESTVAAWLNQVESMVAGGLGYTSSGWTVAASMVAETAVAASGADKIVEHVNLMMFAGQMSPALRKNILDAMAGVDGGSATRDFDRARIAVYLGLASPEYLIQR